MNTTEHIGATGIWSEELAASGAHKHDEALSAAIGRMFGDPRKTLIDFGAGRGDYLRDLNGQFFNVRGYEGTPNDCQYVEQADLSHSRFVPAPCDIAICLEVGEHIPRALMHQFLDNISFNVREMLVLSWAIPGQGGDGHVNELKPETVEQLMHARGFDPSPQHAIKLRQASRLPWFRNTINVFRRA